MLARIARIYKLLGGFVGAQSLVQRASVRRLLPRLRRHGDDTAVRKVRNRSPRVRQLGDAQIRRPRLQRREPAAVHMVQARRVFEVGPVDGELVVGIELAF